MNIAYIGNFEVPFTTENEIRWTFEKLGHTVFKLQENNVSSDEVVRTARERNVKLVLWTHTHSWSVLGDNFRMLEQLRQAGIKTASFHLDLFWGLSKDDGREHRIGDHAFFRTDKFFSADGGNEEKWKEKGVNHYWLKPGVVERDCYLGQPSPQYGNQVIFAGSTTYHNEYPFRVNMVNRLRETYSTNFRTYSGVRQAELNNLYATAKVVVGDHCFAGRPRYASDRLFETTGRGGFLIYPESEGITEEIPGLVTYKPQNMDDLIKKINYWLDDDRNQERIRRRNETHEWVKKNATYTNRVREMLQELGLA